MPSLGGQSLAGHVALVTGSGRNIGRATALALARSGADVVLATSKSREAIEAVAEEARALGVRALPVVVDVGSSAAVRSLADQALEQFGKVDIVVNNAAIRPETPFLELDDETWRRVMATDLDAHFYTARAFLPGMIAQHWGRIINFTGLMAIAGHAGRSSVSVAKHGVWGLTKSLAKEFGGDGVTVNAISPGPIDTDRDVRSNALYMPHVLPNVPVGRFGKPEEVAALCAYLASEEAGFITGQQIGVDGGAAFSVRFDQILGPATAEVGADSQ